jgi:hypothetical protein
MIMKKVSKKISMTEKKQLHDKSERIYAITLDEKIK